MERVGMEVSTILIPVLLEEGLKRKEEQDTQGD